MTSAELRHRRPSSATRPGASAFGLGLSGFLFGCGPAAPSTDPTVVELTRPSPPDTPAPPPPAPIARTIEPPVEMHEPPFEPEEGGVFEGVGVVGVPGGVVGVPGGVVGVPGGVAGTTAPPPPRAKPRSGQTCPVPKDLAESHDVRASVAVSVAVDANGKVTGVSILKDPGHGLGRAAKDCLLGWSFEPALDANGAPVDSKVVVVVRYVNL